MAQGTTMADTPQQVPFAIRSRWDASRIVYQSETAYNLRDAVLECIAKAAAAGQRANMQRANMQGADMQGADINGEKVTAWASLVFDMHGECGRQLTGIRAGVSTYLWCGCFTGSPGDLLKYIAEGSPELRRTRTLALDCMMSFLDAKNGA